MQTWFHGICMAQFMHNCSGSPLLTSLELMLDHCLRLSFAGPWTVKEQRALRRIGQLAQQAYQKPVAIK
jgi:DNA-binding transcriptional MocR family regulator